MTRDYLCSLMVVLLSSSRLLSNLIEKLVSLMCISSSFSDVEVKNDFRMWQSAEQRTTSKPKVESLVSVFSLIVELSIVIVELSAIIKSAKKSKVCKLLSSAELLRSIESFIFKIALFITRAMPPL